MSFLKIVIFINNFSLVSLQKMVKKIIALMICILFFVSLASAATTIIKVKSMPYHNVTLIPFNPAVKGFDSYAHLYGRTDAYGDAVINYDSTQTTFGLMLKIKQGNTEVISKKYNETYSSGTTIVLQLAPDWFEFIATPGENLTEETTDENTTLSDENSTTLEENSTLLTSDIEEDEEGNFLASTGAAVGSVGSIIKSKIFLYSLGGVVILGLIIWLVIFFMKRKKNTFNEFESYPSEAKEIKIRKLSEMKAEQKEINQTAEELKQAEEELRKAQEKINSIRNKDKIEELKQEIARKEQELISLRQGN